MKSFVVILALAIAALASSAHAVQGDKGYYYGAKSPEHLAQLNEETLAKDASGKTMLSAEKCNKDGSCATPLDYFEGINEALKKAGLKKRLKDVSEVPAYMRTLKVIHSPYGKYEVSCLRPIGNDKFKVIMDCLEREFESDEEAWVDSVTEGDVKIDLVIITSKCANVVYRKIVLKITIIGGEPSPHPVAPPVAACRRTGLWVHAFSLADMNPEQRQKSMELIEYANSIDTWRQTRSVAYAPPRKSFSRVMGPQLRDVIPHANVNEVLPVRLRDPKTFQVVETIGTVSMVNGVGQIYPTADQRKFIIEVEFPDYFESPAHRRDGSDKRILLLYPEESWGRCDWMNMSGAMK